MFCSILSQPFLFSLELIIFAIKIVFAMTRFIYTIIAILLLASCRTQKTTEKATESVRTDTIVLFHTDTLYRSLVRTDSIYTADTVRIREKGDTVHVERVSVRFRDRLLRDTIYRSRVDTLYESRTDTLRVADRQTVTRTRKDWAFSLWTLAAGLLLGAGTVWRMKG